MSDPQDPLAAFVDHVVRQLEKNGFPTRRVSFPIERMYESADAKGVNFNRVLDALAARGITHEKTPEKVVFEASVETTGLDAMPGIDPSTLGGFDSSAFAGLDPSALAGLSKEDLFARAQAAMQQMGPEQLAAIRAMVEGMSPAQQAAMIEQAKKLGLA